MDPSPKGGGEGLTLPRKMDGSLTSGRGPPPQIHGRKGGRPLSCLLKIHGRRGEPPFLLAELVKGGGFLTFLAYSLLGTISYERRGTANWSMHINYALLAKTGAPLSPTSGGGGRRLWAMPYYGNYCIGGLRSAGSWEPAGEEEGTRAGGALSHL